MNIDKAKFPDVFIHNDELNTADNILFEEMSRQQLSQNERTFFKNMKDKEENEFAPSADILLDEHDNKDELYLIRYYYNEYKIGRGLPNHRYGKAIYNDSLDATLKTDLYPLLGIHLSFWEWLQKNDFKGVNYNGNYILNR